MKIGIGSYAYPQAMRGIGGQRMTAMDVLAEAHALAVGVCQLAENAGLDGMANVELDELARCARSSNIDIQLGTRLSAADDVRQCFELCQRLNSTLLRVVLRQPESAPARALEDWIEIVGSCAQQAERDGVTLAIENHDSIRAKDLHQIMQSVNSSRVGICFDSANSLGCFEAAEDVLAQLRGHIVCAHIKDVSIRRAGHSEGFAIEGRPAGSGALNIAFLVQQLRALPTDPALIVEHWCAPEKSFAATLVKEKQWTRASLGYLRAQEGRQT